MLASSNIIFNLSKRCIEKKLEIDGLESTTRVVLVSPIWTCHLNSLKIDNL